MDSTPICGQNFLIKNSTTYKTKPFSKFQIIHHFITPLRAPARPSYSNTNSSFRLPGIPGIGESSPEAKLAPKIPIA